jgi:cytochrome c-type biogenesis protein
VNFLEQLSDTYSAYLAHPLNPLLLVALAFVGGLIASLSPCCLSMLPVNLSYIGTRDFTSRQDAFLKAGAFVLGVMTTLSLLGLFSSLATFVLVRYRSYFLLLVGLVILTMAVNLLGWIYLPFSKFGFLSILPGFGPYGVGLTFGLVGSPCASPIMFSILAAAAATGSQVQSTVTMISYALGYSVLIFLCSLFLGLAKQARKLMVFSSRMTRVAGYVLFVVGCFYTLSGTFWILRRVIA